MKLRPLVFALAFTALAAGGARADTGALYRKTAYVAAQRALDQAMKALKRGPELGAVVKDAQKTFVNKNDRAFAQSFLQKQKLSARERLNPASLTRDERGWALRLSPAARPVRIELREGDPLTLLVGGEAVRYETGRAAETFAQLSEAFRRAQEKKAGWLPAMLLPEAVAAAEASSLSPAAMLLTLVAMGKEAWAYDNAASDPALRDVADFYRRLGNVCELERKQAGGDFVNTQTSQDLSSLAEIGLTKGQLESDPYGCAGFTQRSQNADSSPILQGNPKEACAAAEQFFDCAERLKTKLSHKTPAALSPGAGGDTSMGGD